MRSPLLLLAFAAASLPAQGLRFTRAWPALTFKQPVALVSAPHLEGKVFVVEQAGKVWCVEHGHRKLFLDITPEVRRENAEEGLLSLAFHPGRRAKDLFYAIYSVKGASPRRTRLSAFEGTPPQERTLLEIEKPWGNHNGSTLAFGPEGFLYISLGDGGSGGDPHNNAQNLGSLLGKILRIDVDHARPPLAYAVPYDNPFSQTPTARPEIWAYGLRNPWRMAFDESTWALWVGDVGQDTREEIDLVQRGGNYGWNWREGSFPFKQGAPAEAKFIEPVFDYGRDLGFCVTGGVVSRKGGPESLIGRYVFADFGSRRVWSMDAEKPGAGSLRDEGKAPDAVCSFGVDGEGGVYAVGYGGGIWKMDSGQAPKESESKS
jgi:glucose/arabinose dehydrogenase